MYAAVLLVLLILVLLFMKRYAQRVAGAYVNATETISTPAEDTTLTPTQLDGMTLDAARQRVRTAIDDAQGAAIRTLADEEEPP